jgi:hypothetical protein
MSLFKSIDTFNCSISCEYRFFLTKGISISAVLLLILDANSLPIDTFSTISPLTSHFPTSFCMVYLSCCSSVTLSPNSSNNLPIFPFINPFVFLNSSTNLSDLINSSITSLLLSSGILIPIS